MTAVDYCRCNHARQVHESNDGTICAGRCYAYLHTESAHTGACTARCMCLAYSPRGTA